MPWKSLDQRHQYMARPEIKKRELERGKKRRETPQWKKYNTIYQKLWQKKNKAKHLKYVLNWKRNNPEKVAKINYRYIKKKGLSLISLFMWSKLIRNRDKNKCQICGGSSDHSHHIFPKAKYPQLALNLNNGIALCFEHHKEAHGWLN